MGPTLEGFEHNYRERMAEDVVWESVGFPAHEGRDTCIAYLDDLHRRTGMEYCTVEVLSLAADGDVVLSGRVDTMRRAHAGQDRPSGRRLMSAGPDVVLEQLLCARHSCRGFEDRPVPSEVIERLLALAQRSPSWCNTQPWQVIVTEGEGTRRLAKAATAFAAANPPTPDVVFPERYAGIFLERRRECAWQLYDCVGVQKGDRAASAIEAMRNYQFFSAPHVAIITAERDLGTYGAVDCGVYVGCFLLAAQSLGLATIPQAALGAVAPAIRELYNLPPQRQVLMGVSFGYPDPRHPANGFRTRRAQLAEVVTWAN